MQNIPKDKILLVLILVNVVCQFGCATYQYARNIPLVSFDDSPVKGVSIGPVRGEDCTWDFFGYYLGSLPTVDRSFINARNQAGTWESSGIDRSGKDRSGEKIRYVNNVTTETTGFSALVVGKTCLVEKGMGYK